jgi:hypothetical protein
LDEKYFRIGVVRIESRQLAISHVRLELGKFRVARHDGDWSLGWQLLVQLSYFECNGEISCDEKF